MASEIFFLAAALIFRLALPVGASVLRGNSLRITPNRIGWHQTESTHFLASPIRGTNYDYRPESRAPRPNRRDVFRRRRSAASLFLRWIFLACPSWTDPLEFRARQ